MTCLYRPARSYYSVPTCIDSLDRNPGSTATRPATTTTNVTISSFASLLGKSSIVVYVTFSDCREPVPESHPTRSCLPPSPPYPLPYPREPGEPGVDKDKERYPHSRTSAMCSTTAAFIRFKLHWDRLAGDLYPRVSRNPSLCLGLLLTLQSESSMISKGANDDC